MPQFFVSSVGDGRARLGPEESHHLSRVLGLGPGRIVTLFDAAGLVYRARILGQDAHGCVDVEVVEALGAAPRPPVEITLAQAVCAPAAMDAVVQAASQIGVRRLHPLITARVSAVPRAGLEKRHARWERLALAAAKQCGRSHLLELGGTLTLPGLCAMAPEFDVRVFGSLSPARLTEVPAGKPVGALVLVGPEGGLTGEEESLLAKAGFSALKIGPHTLRAETAALALCSVVAYEFGAF